MSEQHILVCLFLHGFIQAQATLSNRKAICKLSWSCLSATAHLGFLGRGLPSRRNLHVAVHSKDPPSPPQSSCCKCKAENKVVLNIHGSWPAHGSLLHPLPRWELGADGIPRREVLPMCKTLFFRPFGHRKVWESRFLERAAVQLHT